jgi:hypothetical protein
LGELEKPSKFFCKSQTVAGSVSPDLVKRHRLAPGTREAQIPGDLDLPQGGAARDTAWLEVAHGKMREKRERFHFEQRENG